MAATGELGGSACHVSRVAIEGDATEAPRTGTLESVIATLMLWSISHIIPFTTCG
jgi:hypothetical protein